MLKTQLPLSEFGLSTVNWRRSIKEGILLSIVLALACTFVKICIIHYVPEYQQLPLFDLNTGFDRQLHVTEFKTALFLIMYIIFSPVQEFLVRGGLQGALYSFLPGKNQVRLWTSIFVSNLMFITFHSHIAFAFVMLTFVPGIVWGWLYARHKTLIGVSISHILVGTYTIFILGLSHFIPGL